MKERNQRILLAIFIFSMLLRKAGFGMGAVLMNITAAFLSLSLIFDSRAFRDPFQRLVPPLLFAVALAFLQYWINLGMRGPVILAGWFVFTIFDFRKLNRSGTLIILWLLLGLVFVSAIIFNPREFHNFYRPGTYEDFIRSKYTEQQGIIADLYIDKYKMPDNEKSQRQFSEALAADSLSDLERALARFNSSVDNDPDNVIATYRRGLFKLTKLDLNYDVASSAAKDFGRVIRLDPDFTYAYFHRGIALGYMDEKGRALLDFRIVWNCDSTLTDEAFNKKYGISKKDFPVPFHP